MHGPIIAAIVKAGNSPTPADKRLAWGKSGSYNAPRPGRREVPPMSRRSQILFWSVAAAVFAWGVFVRSWGLTARPFWQDEAWVANAVTHESWAQLATQTAVPMPPLFALASKAFGSLVSPPEAGLRLLPMFCGMACVPLSYLAVRTLRAPKLAALAGMAACASSLMLVVWSREAKQYEIEAFLGLLLALLVFRTRRCPPARSRGLAGAGIVVICLVGPWLGYGVVLPALTLVSLLIVLRPLAGPRGPQVILGAASLAALAVSVLAVEYVAAAQQAANPALLSFTRHWFVDPTSISSWLRAGAYAAWSSGMLFLPQLWVSGLAWAGLAAAVVWALALLGLLTWPRSGRIEMLCWVLGPWLLMLAAAIARRYPFAAPRMMAFAAAPTILAVVMGLVRVCRGCSIVVTGRGGPGLFAAVILTLLPAIYMIRVPIGHRYAPNHGFPALLRTLEHERRPGELAVVTMNAVPSVQYYAPSIAEPVVFVPVAAGVTPVPDFDYSSLVAGIVSRAGPRCWMVSIDEPTDTIRQDLLRALQASGYSVRVAAQAGTNDSYGMAELLSAARSPFN